MNFFLIKFLFRLLGSCRITKRNHTQGHYIPRKLRIFTNNPDTRMFGISDSLIILPYLLSVVCVLFAAWFGFKYWNKDDEKDKTR